MQLPRCPAAAFCGLVARDRSKVAEATQSCEGEPMMEATCWFLICGWEDVIVVIEYGTNECFVCCFGVFQHLSVIMRARHTTSLEKAT
jgi:hypothetical protein